MGAATGSTLLCKVMSLVNHGSLVQLCQGCCVAPDVDVESHQPLCQLGRKCLGLLSLLGGHSRVALWGLGCAVPSTLLTVPMLDLEHAPHIAPIHSLCLQGLRQHEVEKAAHMMSDMDNGQVGPFGWHNIVGPHETCVAGESHLLLLRNLGSCRGSTVAGDASRHLGFLAQAGQAGATPHPAPDSAAWKGQLHCTACSRHAASARLPEQSQCIHSKLNSLILRHAA